MNILHIETGRHLAGGPRQVLTLMHGLKKAGHLSSLLCPNQSEIGKLARQQGLTVKLVEFSGEHDLSFIGKINKSVKQLQPDIVHVHSRRGADTFAALYARFSAVPCVLTRRITNLEPKWLAGLKYKPYKKIAAVSQAVALVLSKQGVAAERRQLIYDGIEPFNNELMSRSAFLKALDLPEKAVVLANVGRFTENKNQLHSINAFALIAENNPRAHLVLFGDGKLGQTLENRVGELGLGKRVHFAGFKQDMKRWYGGVDILMHTATLEALSVAILEAAACGIPSVAYNTGGVREVIQHNQTGYLVQLHKLDQLAHATERLITNSRLREKMGLAASERVEELFSAERMVSQYIDLYQQVLASSK